MGAIGHASSTGQGKKYGKRIDLEDGTWQSWGICVGETSVFALIQKIAIEVCVNYSLLLNGTLP